MVTQDELRAAEPDITQGEVRLTTMEPPPTTASGHDAEVGVHGRRKHPRYQVELEVSLGSEHNFYAGLARNISAGGLFVATHRSKPVGERIALRIQLPDSSKTIEAAGVVRWVREYSETSNCWPGMGIEFVELGGEELATIEEFLASREPMLFE